MQSLHSKHYHIPKSRRTVRPLRTTSNLFTQGSRQSRVIREGRAKTSMFYWLKQKFRHWLYYDSSESLSPSSKSTTVESESLFSVNIYTANGGNILEIRRYDHKKDENTYTLHVVPEDQDFSRKCADIISLEIMKS